MKTKIIAVLIALVVMVGIVSGALVNYISSPIETITEVQSPIELSEEQWFSTIFAGSDATLTALATNRANRCVCGYGELYVEVDVPGDGLGYTDFDGNGMDISARMQNCGGFPSVLVPMNSIGEGRYTSPCCCLSAGESDTVEVYIGTTSNLEPGDYKFTLVVRPCTEEECGMGDCCWCGCCVDDISGCIE